ncbi:hypothetical protein F5X98DRAFT_294745 [Xylaria grammica]|nr:hypothetical protein F5X98DRAFT_294745 [Xylaria grammica]
MGRITRMTMYLAGARNLSLFLFIFFSFPSSSVRLGLYGGVRGLHRYSYSVFTLVIPGHLCNWDGRDCFYDTWRTMEFQVTFSGSTRAFAASHLLLDLPTVYLFFSYFTVVKLPGLHMHTNPM